ncbi:hypothetical protein ACFLQX_02765 [Bacteroidota bacterium]
MFKAKSLHLIVAFLILFAGGILRSAAQNSDTVKLELKERALEKFDQEEYDLALYDYLILMDKFPRDPMYKYYCGVCMVELNLDFEEAVEMLHFSSSRGVPMDVYFYLGEAYRKMYDFKKAKQYYLQFDKEAPRSIAKSRNSKLLIRSIQTASRITSEYTPFEVLNVTSMNLYDPDQYQQIRMKGGVLQQKPEGLFSVGEDRDDLNSIMFLPEQVNRGEYVYFTGYENNGKNGSQIFQAKKGNTGKWADIKPITELNTEMNEILPYFDPVSKDIYFASDGFEGIGGFDLYRSHYDEERKEWSEPMNLGFPINSAFDDYLLLPGRDLGMVMFFTGRTGSDSASTVYQVHFSEPKLSLASETPQEIRRIANLGGRAAEVLKEIETQQPASITKTDKTPEAKAQNVVEEDEQTKTTISKVDNEYQSLVAAALRHQTVSDSLTELSTNARIKVRESDDPNDRWLYQKQILVWEKKATSEQQEADNLYAKIGSFDPAETTEIPGTIEKDTVVSNITVYRFKETEKETASVNKQEATPLKKEEKKMEDSYKGPTSSINRFVKLDASPYSADNPIPLDPQFPEGSYYRIQVGAFSMPVAPDAFGGLSPITGETIPERNLTKYYVGKFSKYLDAVNALSEVRSSGFEKAFIVSWYDGTKMTLDKVRKLEK